MDLYIRRPSMRQLIPALSAIVLAIGCSSSGDYSWVTHIWTTDHGVFAMDHVSRNKVDVTQAVRRTYLGETYYFENEENARVFDRRPAACTYTDNVQLMGRPDRIDQN
jgi:YHS domain-containing protein